MVGLVGVKAGRMVGLGLAVEPADMFIAQDHEVVPHLLCGNPS